MSARPPAVSDAPARPAGDIAKETLSGFPPGVDDETLLQQGRVATLDGVRSLAVFLVLLFHLGVPGLSGGYLGVDMFFVLSGFLITTLLLRDIVTHGRIDLPRFWARRVARLIPAVLLLLLVVGVWALVSAPAFRRPALGADVLWCLLYVGNWHFIDTASYFAFDGTTSPVLHLWSLAVEEQFYLVWPLILSGVALLLANVGGGRHARRDIIGARLRTTTAVMATGTVLAVASAAAMAWWSAAASPDRAYMGTDAKVFEPLLGAVLAAAAVRPRVATSVRHFAPQLLVVGTGGVILAVALLAGPTGPPDGYYSGGALLTCFATVALVAGASQTSTARGLGRLYAAPVVTYLGRISYGIYLWHWPWAFWLRDGDGFTAPEALIVILLTVATAAASYHLVELPLRSGRFRAARPIHILRAGLVGIAASTVLPVLLGATPWFVGAGSKVDGPSAQETHRGGGATPRTVMLVGDSVPLQLFGAFGSAGEERGITVVSAAQGGCAASGVVSVDPQGRPFYPPRPADPLSADGPICAGVPAEQSDKIAGTHPDLVLWWSRFEYADTLGPDGRPLRFGEPLYLAHQRATLDASVDRLTAGGARLVVVQPEPTGSRTAQGCSPELTGERSGDCATFDVRLRFEDAARQQWIRVLREKAAADPRLTLIRMDDVFCRSNANPCDDNLPLANADGTFPPAVLDSARPDGTHFAATVRDRIAREAIARAIASTSSNR